MQKYSLTGLKGRANLSDVKKWPILSWHNHFSCIFLEINHIMRRGVSTIDAKYMTHLKLTQPFRYFLGSLKDLWINIDYNFEILRLY